MHHELETFTIFFPEEYLNTIEIERQKITAETEIMAYLKAFNDVLERLILDESAFTTFKKGFSQKELNQIIKMTLRINFLTVEQKGIRSFILPKILAGNEDPAITCWYQFLFMEQQDIEEKYQNLILEWEKIKEYDHTNDIQLILDKLDVILFLREVARNRLDQVEAKKYYDLFLQLISSCNRKDLILEIYKIYGNITMAFAVMTQGKVDFAKKLIDQALKNTNQLDNSFIKSQLFNIYGVYFVGVGYLGKAIEQYQLSAEYATNISQKSYRYLVSLVNMGDTYLRQGKYDEALQMTQKAIEINPDQAFVPRINKAHIKSLQGKFSEALKEVEMIFLDFPVKTIDKSYYFYLRRIQFESFIEVEKYENGEQIINELEQMAKESKAEQFQAWIHYFQGLIELKKMNITSAKILFLKTIEASYFAVDGYSLRLKAELQLSNVLLNSYKFSDNKLDFKKSMSLIETVIQAAEEQNTFVLLCNGLIIHARMLDIQEKEEEAINELKKALSIANKYGLAVLQDRIKSQLQLIEKRQKKLSKKEKTTGLIGYLAKFLRSISSFESSGQVQEIASKIHGLMIASHTGLALYSRYYNDNMKTDDQLVSGLLSAVSAFITEVFTSKSGGGLLKSINHENITILLEEFLENYTLVFFADKDTSAIRSKLIQLAQNIEMSITDQNISLDEIEAQNKYGEIIDPILADFFPQKMIE
jgi:tetratricopeptide (TPR) repeat protein